MKRKAVNRENITQLSGTKRVSDLLADAKALLSTNVDARGLEMRLHGPDGDRINGNTNLQTVRKMESVLPSEGEKLDIFFDMLADIGIDDISIKQAGGLYVRLRDIMGGDLFDQKLHSSVE